MQLARYFWLRINKMLFNYNKTFKQVDYHWSSKNISICRRYLREHCSEEYIRPRPSSTSFTPSHSCLSPLTICPLLTPSVCVAITWIKDFQDTLYLCWVPPLLNASQTWSRPPRTPMWTSPRWPTRWWRGPATPAGWWSSKPWSPHTTSWCMATRWA